MSTTNLDTIKQFLAASLAVSLAFYPLPALSLPAGGTVASGGVSMNKPNATTLNINQTTNKAIINWNGFNINVNELVRVNQPSSSAVLLNRVTGGSPTSILGNLIANGRVFVVNPNGVFFGPTAKVDASGLLATTLNIRDADFLAGKYLFSKDPAKDASYVINQGQIKVSDNGFVFLVAPGVSNENLIIANLGKVVLASGNQFTVDFLGDGLVNFVVDGKVLDKVAGPDGKPITSAVNNSGTIKADGGQVIMSARASGEIFNSVVNNSGVIEAKSLVNRGGVIRLEGSDPVENKGEIGWQANLGKVNNADGVVMNSGTLNVSAAETGAAPGQVTMTGQMVGLSGAILAKGGQDMQGGNILISSTDKTIVTGGGTIDASGLGNSSGGNVVVWSDTATWFAGTILSKGGALGGNGGNVEVSGHKSLGFYGSVDLGAVKGVAGILLLDPQILTVVNNGGGLDFFLNNESDTICFTCSDSESPDTVSVTRINQIGANSDITLQAGQINFENSSSIVMGANRNISFETNRAEADGGNNNIANTGGNPFSITTSGLGSIDFTTSGSGNVNLTNVTLVSPWFIGIRAGGAVTLGSVNAQGSRGELVVRAGGAITNAPGANISVGGDGAYFRGASVNLGNNPGDIVNLERLWFESAGQVNIRTLSAISLSVSRDSGALDLELISGPASSAGSLVLNSISGGINQNPGGESGLASNILVTGNASFAGNSISLGTQPAVSNNFGTLTFNSSGAVNIAEQSSIILTGTNTASSLVLNANLNPLGNIGNTNVSVTGDASLTAAGIALANGAGSSFSVGGTASLKATFGIVDVGGNGGTANFGKLNVNASGTAAINEASDTVLTGSNSALTLSLVSTGSITNDPNTSLAVTTNASFNGTSINLGNQSGDLFNFGSLRFNSAGAVNIAEDSATLLTISNTANNLTLASTGAITNDPLTSLVVTNNASLSGTSINLGNHIGEDRFDLGSLTATATSSGGGIFINEASALAAVTAKVNGGNVAIDWVDGGPRSLAFTGGSNEFTINSPVTASFENTGGGIVVTGTNQVIGNLVLTANGPITNTNNARGSVSGNVNLTGSSITLVGQSDTNSFSSGSLTFNSGGVVNIEQESATRLVGGSTAGGLILSSEGSITNDAHATLTVTGNAMLNGAAINLGNQSGDRINFGSLTFNSPGTINIREDSSIFITGTNTANNLVLAALGSISDDPSMILTVTGNANYSGTSVTIGSTVNQGTLTFNSGGAVDVTQENNIVLTGSNSANSVRLTSNNGGITNTANTSANVTNNASLTGRNGSIDIGNQSNDSFSFGTTTFNSNSSVNIAQENALLLAGANRASTASLSSPVSIDAAPGTTLDIADPVLSVFTPNVGAGLADAAANAGLTIAPGGTVPVGTDILSSLQNRLVNLVTEDLTLERPIVVQLDEDLKKRLQIVEGTADMMLALGAVILNFREDVVSKALVRAKRTYTIESIGIRLDDVPSLKPVYIDLQNHQKPSLQVSRS